MHIRALSAALSFPTISLKCFYSSPTYLHSHLTISIHSSSTIHFQYYLHPTTLPLTFIIIFITSSSSPSSAFFHLLLSAITINSFVLSWSRITSTICFFSREQLTIILSPLWSSSSALACCICCCCCCRCSCCLHHHLFISSLPREHQHHHRFVPSCAARSCCCCLSLPSSFRLCSAAV